MALGIWGAGCSVPSTEEVLNSRVCKVSEQQQVDGTLQLAGSSGCDRSFEVELSARGFRPGCVNVSVLDAQDKELGSLPMGTRDHPITGTPARLRVFLSSKHGSDFKVVTSAFAQGCTGAPEVQSTQPIAVKAGELGTLRVGLVATDADGDGYTREGTDCDDANPGIHPNQPEPLCNGIDENCDGVPDESFGVGTTCRSSTSCDAILFCSPDGLSTECREPIHDWYIDEDGDGRTGTKIASQCAQPTPEASRINDDCDESSPWVAKGLPELCDRLDNDCDGKIDTAGCTLPTWKQASGTGTTNWQSISLYAKDQMWIAGENRTVLHFKNGTTSFSQCSGGDVSWSSKSGRVFFKAYLYNQSPSTTQCRTPFGGATSEHPYAVTGIEDPWGGEPTIYSGGSGSFYRWTFPWETTENLSSTSGDFLVADIDSHGTTDTLIAVGGFYSPEEKAFAAIYHPESGTWQTEAPTPASGLSSSFLNKVRVLDKNNAYALNNNGSILERNRGTWRLLPSITSSSGQPIAATDVIAFSRNAIYATTLEGSIYFYGPRSGGANGWSLVHPSSGQALRAIDGLSPTDIWAVGDQGTLIHFAP